MKLRDKILKSLLTFWFPRFLIILLICFLFSELIQLAFKLMFLLFLFKILYLLQKILRTRFLLFFKYSDEHIFILKKPTPPSEIIFSGDFLLVMNYFVNLSSYSLFKNLFKLYFFWNNLNRLNSVSKSKLYRFYLFLQRFISLCLYFLKRFTLMLFTGLPARVLDFLHFCYKNKIKHNMISSFMWYTYSITPDEELRIDPTGFYIG